MGDGVSEKSCGTCSMCCKHLFIVELAKPAGEWCSHVVRGGGCGIYDTRPTPCREFLCNWRLNPGLDDSWRPDKAGFLLWTVSERVMLVVVEPSKPDAWKRRPYYAQLKDWSKTALTGVGTVVVKVRNATTVVLPHADISIGDVVVSDEIAVRQQIQGLRRQIWIEVTHCDGRVSRFDA